MVSRSSTGGPAPLLPRVALGDQRAVEECVDRYGGLVWSLARRYCPESADAEDAVQEIMIELWRIAGRFDPTVASELTFVAMIARRRLFDRRRSSARAPQKSELSLDLAEKGRALDEIVSTNVDAGLAREAMEQLKPDQQKVLKMAIWQDLTHQEIATVTGMPLGTVKTFVRRGLLQLRELLTAARSDASKTGGLTR